MNFPNQSLTGVQRVGMLGLLCLGWLATCGMELRAGDLSSATVAGTGSDEAKEQQLPWPQFRGPDGMGQAVTLRALPESFGESKNLKWKVTVPGMGWSSPVVSKDRIWLTMAEPLGQRTERKGSGGPEFTYDAIELYLLSFDRQSGAATSKTQLFSIRRPEIIHSLNSYASPTPCLGWDEKNGVIVYCHFGTYGTAAVRASDQEVLWRNDTIHLDHQTGPGSSPVLVGSRLIFHADGIDTQSIVALNVADGSLAWQTQRSGEMQKQADMKKAFCTPLLVDWKGRSALVSTAADWMYLYDPATGEEWLKVPYGQLGFSTVPRPVAVGSTIYLCTGFMKSRLLAVDLAGEGVEPAEQRIQWTYDRQVPTMPSPLIWKDRLLLVSDTGIATWLDRESGQSVWTERLGGKFASSPLLADGKIYVGNQDGEVFVLQPGDEYRCVSTNQLDSEVMASPVAVDDQLLIRTADSLYCFVKEEE